MRNLAAAHGETGWQAHAFPLSVDGIEIVASLVLLAVRRTGRPAGWLPWAALAAGTTASLAANVAAAGTDLISRVVAGWPAFALLVAISCCPGCSSADPDDDRLPVPSIMIWSRPAGTGRSHPYIFVESKITKGSRGNTDIRGSRGDRGRVGGYRRSDQLQLPIHFSETGDFRQRGAYLF